jgi:hypothetical protein
VAPPGSGTGAGIRLARAGNDHQADRMTSLVERTDLTFWYFREGIDRLPWSSFDRVWPVADENGAAVGSVAFDAGFLAAPRVWLRDEAGVPVIGLISVQAGGIFSAPEPQIVWPDGSTVAAFRTPEVWWGQQVIGKWQVQVDLERAVGRFGGAWMWDEADRPVAAVSQVRDPDVGSHLRLKREPDLPELLAWATLAFPLAVYHQLRGREVADERGDRPRRDTTDLL